MPGSLLHSLLLFVAIGMAGDATAQVGQADARVRHERKLAEIARMWDAVRKASPEFSRLFCAGPAPRNEVCVPDWDGFRSPVGGWRLVDPARCEIDPKPCSLGPRVTPPSQNAKHPSQLDLAARRPPPLPPGSIASWLPCDVFPDPNDPSSLKCDDICGCSILQANCAGKWSCSVLPDECTCSP